MALLISTFLYPRAISMSVLACFSFTVHLQVLYSYLGNRGVKIKHIKKLLKYNVSRPRDVLIMA